LTSARRNAEKRHHTYRRRVKYLFHPSPPEKTALRKKDTLNTCEIPSIANIGIIK
jgi:hypothetical protein